MADDKITSMEQFQRERGEDDARFLCCPACQGEDFSVVARFASGRPFVASLVCMSEQCDGYTEIMVEHGFLT